MLAPIIVFAFNRPDLLTACINSLLTNKEAGESDLFVFVDGPRLDRPGEEEKVMRVREIASRITGFRSLITSFSEMNKGLAPSIITGVSEVISRFGRAIIIEDDLYLSPSFLKYMNTMLDAYEGDSRIMQVTGYSSKIRHAWRFGCDYYLTRRAHPWSWATWKDRWETVDWDVKDYEALLKSRKQRRAFCKYGSDLFGMLKGWKTGKNCSWFVRFAYSMHKQERFSIAPIRSLVRNDGFGIDAENCTNYNRYKVDFLSDCSYDWRIVDNIEWNKRLDKESVRYWTIPYRIYGKIMTILTAK